jgi:acyl transferase domain-containing protein/acyl carrier protein
MIDFLEYILLEVKNKRLAKDSALEVVRQFQEGRSKKPSTIHPLVQRNTSSLLEQRFSATFSGEEFFLADHVVQEMRVLPGAAHLEMARAAVAQALELPLGSASGLCLENVVFARPVVVAEGAALAVHIALEAEGDGAVGFEIYSGSGDEEVVHSQGRAVLAAPGNALRLDLARLKQCSSAQRLEAAQCYAGFAQMGLRYGPAHRALTALQVGQDGSEAVVVGELRLPSCISDTAGAYVLHPALLDAALQSCIGLMLTEAGHSGKPALPFAVERVEMYGAIPAQAYAVVRYSAGSDAHSAVQKLDVAVTDADGQVCVQIKGFSSRVVEGMVGTTKNKGTAAAGTPALIVPPVGELTLAPVWDSVMPAMVESWPQAEQCVLLIGGDDDQQKHFRQHYPQAGWMAVDAASGIEEIAKQLIRYESLTHVFWIVPASDGIELSSQAMIDAQQSGVLYGFRLLKALLALGYGSKSIGLTIITQQAQAISQQDPICPEQASVHGFVGALAKEYTHWRIRLLDLPLAQAWPLGDLLTLPAAADGNTVVYQNGQWYRQRLLSSALPMPAKPVYRHGGVYVILGGAGGIGEVYSAYLIERYQAQLVWIGRRAEDEAIAQKRERLAALGPKPHYIAADATNRMALAAAYDEIKAHFGGIHGVIHATIVLEDQSLARMEETSFVATLAAKVNTSVHMADVFEQEPLDFILFFSSLQSLIKAPGQSNYAAGCTFTDAYAHALSRMKRCPVNVINWGYWGSVGIVASDAYRARMAQAGIGSIEPQEAMAALEKLLGSSVQQIVFLKTTRPEVATGLGVVPGDTLTVVPSLPPLPADLSTQTSLPLPVEPIAMRHDVAGLDALLGKLLWGQLHELGLFSQTPLNVSKWQEQVKLPVLYQRWLAQSLRVLAAQGYLTQQGDQFIPTQVDAPSMQALWAQWEQHKAQWLEDPQRRAQTLLVDAALRALPAILKGELAATTVLFPNSSMELVEGIYKHNRISDYFNAVLAERLLAYIEARRRQQPDVKLRLIEIGAGTGGTSALLFERLAPYAAHLAEYCYTDISKAFLLHAEHHYASKAPYLSTRLFNVEAPLAGQDMEAGAYDIAIATNVLHATKDMRQTLRNAKALLKGQGVLLVNEITGYSLFTHLTFGLLEGWWLYEDAASRVPGSPALAPPTWQSLLAAEGFAAVAFPATAAHELGQQIILAQSNGVVRQAAAMPAASAARPPKAAPAAPAASESAPLQQGAAGELKGKVEAALVGMVSELLKIKREDIDVDTALDEFGFDSITLTAFGNALNQKYGLELTPTAFFEYPTLEGLAGYLARDHRALLLQTFAVSVKPAVAAGAAPAQAPPQLATPALARRRRARFAQAGAAGAQRAQAGPATPEPIAIIGISGRYPNADTLEEYWDNLVAGKDCITEIPKDRWALDGFYCTNKEDALHQFKSYSKFGGFLNNIEHFDYEFFGLSPVEAAVAGPAELLLLETTWNMFEAAGYTKRRLQTLCQSDVGVYIGAMMGTQNYYGLNSPKNPPVAAPTTSVLSHRISQFFNFCGPSVAIDTQSSSSLTAVHMACEGLRRGDCEMAVAGGISLLYPELYIGLSRQGIIGSSLDSRSFALGDGSLLSEGVGTILLKPLDKALKDGDTIHAVIRSTALGHAGKGTSGLVVNHAVQAKLFETAIARAGINAREISFVESAANGSAVGDPIELSAMSRAFRKFTSDTKFCAVGSVKSNIGHAVAASGISQLTKVILQLQHKKLVPLIGSASLNPNLSLEGSPFYLQRELSDWESRPEQNSRNETPRRALVNSFGAGGAYVSLVLEDYGSATQEHVASSNDGASHLVPLSAKTAERLKVSAQQLLQYLEKNPSVSLENLAYTLQTGRDAMTSRLAIIAANTVDLITSLRAYVADDVDFSKSMAPIYAAGEADQWGSFRQIFDSDVDILTQKYIKERSFEKLALCWVNGVEVEWEKLYEGAPVATLSLPTYPFTRKSIVYPSSIECDDAAMVEYEENAA